MCDHKALREALEQFYLEQYEDNMNLTHDPLNQSTKLVFYLDLFKHYV
jgi:hypothetical protein